MKKNLNIDGERKQIVGLDPSIYTKDRKNMKVKNLRLLVPCALQDRAKRKN
jgi:hypothetical protein